MMSNNLIFWVIWSASYLVSICAILYMIFKLDSIADNLESSFTFFNEEIITLSDILKDYQKRLDQEDIPTIPLKKDVSGW